MEKIITAILAVCAIMAVLSTVVTVAQEAVHKGLQSRRAGLFQLMQSLYLRSLAPRLRNEKLLPKANPLEDMAAARRFALDMTANETIVQTGVWKAASTAPVLRHYFGGRLERMSTRQFAEQLARSQIGWLIKHKDDTALAQTLHQFAYDFDRFGEKQSGMFARKAKATAVLLGVTLALLLNVDIVHVFRTFMADSALANQVIDRSTEELAGRPGARAPADAPGAVEPQAALQESTEDLKDAVQSLKAEVTALRGAASGYQSLGLPVGPRVFPFCNPSEAAPLAENVAPRVDARCDENGPAGIGLLARQDTMMAAYAQGQGGAGCDLDILGWCYSGEPLQRLWERIRGDNGMIWLISVLVAGGGFGLGAPFWFNIAQKVGGGAGGRAAQLGALEPAQGFMPAARSDTPMTGPDLVQAFRTVGSVNG